MRIIQLQSVEFRDGDLPTNKAKSQMTPAEQESLRVSYRLWAQQVIQAPAPGGFTYKELEPVAPVVEKLRVCPEPGVLALTDAEWSLLCKKLDTYRWGVMDPRILGFVVAVVEAEDTTNGEPAE